MIYFDYNATTPVDPEVSDAMKPFIDGRFGNPSSGHAMGREARRAVEEAREQIAAFLGCDADEVLFTSGGSESNNYVIKGVAHSFRNKGDHIITTKIEHPSVLNPCSFLEQMGYRVSYAPVDEYGRVAAEEIGKLITGKTILVSVMHANNETGTIQPVKEIAKLCRNKNIFLHTDAAQSLGKIPANVRELGVDFLTVAGHKLYAPKGIGATYIRRGIHIEPLIHGAGHESGRRAGTENVIFDVALGKACEIAGRHLTNNQIKELTGYLHGRLMEAFGPRIRLNGHPSERLPNTLNISFVGFEGHVIMDKMVDTAVSTGSACHTGLTAISPVLKAMNVNEEIARGAVRFSLGRYTTKDEIDALMERLQNIIQ